MLVWTLAGLMTLLCCAALYRAARAGGMPAGAAGPVRDFHRSQLTGIEADLAAGRLSEPEATAAKAELAREYLRAKAEEKAPPLAGSGGRWALLAVLPVVALGSLGLYALAGRADLPAVPLADRESGAAVDPRSLEDAVAVVEERLAATPNDIRGWQALGPVYMQIGRYGEAAGAFRRILEIEPPTADRESDLAEALIMAGDGEADEESLTLLRSAAGRDPTHVRSRFYLAGELTRAGDFEEARDLWTELLELATGEEAWVATARAGLSSAEAGIAAREVAAPQPDGTAAAMIRGMVEGLAARIEAEGGSLQDWMHLVRSRMVIDGPERARDDLARGLAALPESEAATLRIFAAELGIETTEQGR